jgi:hypothetical protein
MTSFSLDGKQQLIQGVFDEFVRRMEATGDAIHPSKTTAGDWWAGYITYGHDKVTPFEPEAAKRVALEMCLEAGVEIMLHTAFVDSVVVDGVMTHAIVANKSGLQAAPSAVFVDCSADGDVAARAGAPFELGRPEDGLMQPMTQFFRIRNVDDAAVQRYQHEHPEEFWPFQAIVEKAREEGKFPVPRKGVQLFRTMVPGVWRINTTRILGVDGTNGADITRAQIEGHFQVHALVEFFRENLPGLEDCVLLDTAAVVGVRETRRIIGEHVLDLRDLETGRHFDDVIALCGYPVDIHSPTSADGPFDDSDFKAANAYEIPYRSLVPLAVEQLLVAGRCLSSTHEALAAVRVMPPAFATGEAAGTAAALSATSGVSPREMNVADIQAQLLRQGAYLGPEPTYQAELA